MSNPEEEEEEERRTCTRCNEEEPEEGEWDGNEDQEDGDLFCPVCFQARDKSGSPYKSDHLEMLSNPRSYLPYGY